MMSSLALCSGFRPKGMEMMEAPKKSRSPALRAFGMGKKDLLIIKARI